MIIEESLWIKDRLSQLDLPEGSYILDIGSSTKEHRQSIQPHIDGNVFLPLQKRGFHIVHMDKKTGDGVDIIGDIEDPNIVQKISRCFDLVICTNMLEHVTNIQMTIKNIIGLVSKDGYLLLTAPLKYPKHKDPIDNLYRASDKDLQELLLKYTSFTVIFSKVLDIRNRMYYVCKSRYPLWGYRKFRFWRYYFKPFRWKISYLLVRIS